MDDAKIDLIAREVLTSLKKAHAHEASSALRPSGRPEPAAVHPSLRILSVTGGVVGSVCVIDPGKICDGSLTCRTFGH